jgi:uncharacterized Zn finger protein
MKLSDISCPSCLASYQVAVSTSAKGAPGRAHCIACGSFLEAWDEPALRVYRLVLSSERKYSNVPLPPPPGN